MQALVALHQHRPLSFYSPFAEMAGLDQRALGESPGPLVRTLFLVSVGIWHAF